MSGLELTATGLVVAVFVWCAFAATWWLLHELFGGDR